MIELDTDLTERAYPPPKGIVMRRNVQQCLYCHGQVDRAIKAGTENQIVSHAFGQTLYFECRNCHALGDPFVGIMDPPDVRRTV